MNLILFWTLYVTVKCYNQVVMFFRCHAFNVHSVTWQEVTFTVFWKQRMVSDLVLLPLLGSPCHSLLAWSIGTGYRAQLFGQILMETLAKRCSYKKSGKVFTAGEQKFLLWHLPVFFFKCAWREYDSKDHTVCKTHKKWDDRREPCQSIDTFFLNPREEQIRQQQLDQQTFATWCTMKSDLQAVETG